jgi:hypothetical protein
LKAPMPKAASLKLLAVWLVFGTYSNNRYFQSN